MLLGFGLVFLGIDLMTSGVESFYGYPWFRKFFLIENPFVLVVNGFLLTAVFQSSSVVSSMLVILSAGGMITFENSVFVILGANVGTTVSVLLISSRKSVAARRVAFFNFLFNLLGAALFFVPTLLFGEKITELFTSTSASLGRAVANFHTFFNLATGLIALPFLKWLSRLLLVAVKDGEKIGRAGGAKSWLKRRLYAIKKAKTT